MLSNPLWAPLIVAAVLAWISAVLAFFLYRYGEAVIERRGVRLGGAAAIAALAFLGMADFYIELRSDIRSDAITELSEQAHQTEQMVRAYDLCAEHEQTFACYEPAQELRDACTKLLEHASSR